MNLNNSQLRVLRWLINKTLAGELDENDIYVLWTNDGTGIMGYKGNPIEISKLTLIALENEGFIIGEEKNHGYRFSLTAKANHEMLNESKPSKGSHEFLSGIKTLENLSNIDSEIHERSLANLIDQNNKKQWDSAVRTTTVILEERLRSLLESNEQKENLTGNEIVNRLFRNETGVLTKKIGNEKAKAYRDLFSGVMLTFRNPSNHRFIDPEPESGATIILFINHLLKLLSDLEAD